MGRLSVLASSFAFIAGYGLRYLLVCQSPSQLRDPELYGPDMAATILDNCGAEVAFAAKNPKLCEEMSAWVGYNTVDSVTRNRPRFWAAWQWRKQSVAAHPHSRAQLLPQEIFRMRHHQELIFRSGLVRTRLFMTGTRRSAPAFCLPQRCRKSRLLCQWTTAGWQIHGCWWWGVRRDERQLRQSDFERKR